MPTEREKILESAQRFLDKKRYDRAIAEYQKLVQADPGDARTWLKIGDLQARTGAIQEAIATYDQVGQRYASQGFALKAIAVYKQIRELIKKQAPQLSDQYAYILPRLGAIYAELGLTSDALNAFDEMAAYLQRTGRDVEAIVIFQRMVEVNRDNPLPHLRLAEAYCRVQQVDDAVDSFWTAAELLLAMRREEDALKVVERILHFRQDVRFARVAAELYLKRSDRESALLALAKLQLCFQADPKNMDTLALLAQAFNAIGQENKSLEVYKEMARIARDQNQTELYGQLLSHLRNTAPEDEQVREFRTLHPIESVSVSAASLSAPSAGSRASAPPGAQALSRPPIHTDEIDSLDDDIELLDDSSLSSLPPSASNAPPGEAHHAPTPSAVANAQASGSTSGFPGASEQKALLDAESFRRLRLHEKAVGVLHRALEAVPDSLELRVKLLEILVEMGDRESAVLEQINVAALYINLGDLQTAEPLLYEVLEASPGHPDALRLLTDYIDPAAGAQPKLSTKPPVQSPDSQRAILPGEALPSYDLEEVSVAQTLASDAPSSSGSLTELDDPFGTGLLPSFPLSSEEAPTHQNAPSGAPGEHLQAREPSLQPASPEAVEEVLEEAEFFGSQGLWEDARGILIEQLSRSPNHPLLLERLREVESAMQGAGESQTIERSSLGIASRKRSVDNLDISSSLEALDSLELPRRSSAPPPAVRSDADVDRIFASFKNGVKGQVAETDSATHYDLGMAYKEMGLHGEAIAEFTVAGKDPARSSAAYAMIGMIHLERGQVESAISAYEHALTTVEKGSLQAIAIHFDLGVAHELVGAHEQALEQFSVVREHDPDYRDVSERMATLEGRQSGAVSSKRALEGDHLLELDSFDDIVDSKSH